MHEDATRPATPDAPANEASPVAVNVGMSTGSQREPIGAAERNQRKEALDRCV